MSRTQSRPTAGRTRKLAYGQAVVEVVFNAHEFPALLGKYGLRVCDVVKSIPHGYLNEVLLEPITAITYICERD